METKSESEITINHLPEDVLLQIFRHLDDIDVNSTSISLVCKQFCSLSSSLLRRLYMPRHSSLTFSEFRRLFKRFTCLKKIYIVNCLKLDNVLMAISNSGLNLEKLFLCNDMNALYHYPEQQTMEVMSTSQVIKSIKSLLLNHGFDGPPGQQQLQLIKFINMFPSLIEFDFTHRWDDEGVHKVTSKFLNLQKVTIINSTVGMITDKTLDILSSNCPNLETVNFQGCRKFTPEALYTFFCNNPQLSSVGMPDFYSYSISEVVKCMEVLQNLSYLSLGSTIVQDAVLIALAKSRPPLKSLRLGGSGNYTMSGLIPLLSACPGLEELNIHLPVPNNNTHDAEMSIAVERLPKLKHIMVLCCTVVCRATLFSLVQNCPLLETIWVDCDSKLKEKQVCDQGMGRPTKKNYSIKSIVIDPRDSNMVLLSTLESYCPNIGW